jgi:hypothetical protein
MNLATDDVAYTLHAMIAANSKLMSERVLLGSLDWYKYFLHSAA